MNLHYLRPADSFTAQMAPYLSARALEGRLYSDAEIAQLPQVPATHPLAAEWRVRQTSLNGLRAYLRQRFPAEAVLLEIGCGNGWLANALAENPAWQVYGLDVNEPELVQGARVFAAQANLHFVLGDVFTDEWPFAPPTCIVLASVIQYFPDLPALLQRLFTLLAPQGEIHVLDSPLYVPAALPAAAARSQAYYTTLGVPAMAAQYHHHSLLALQNFSVTWHYRPNTWLNQLRRVWLRQPLAPFPWLHLHG